MLRRTQGFLFLNLQNRKISRPRRNSFGSASNRTQMVVCDVSTVGFGEDDLFDYRPILQQVAKISACRVKLLDAAELTDR